YNHYQPQPAMAGLFGWLRKAFQKVVNTVASFMPAPVANVLTDFVDGDGSFFGIQFGTIGDGINNGFLFRQQPGLIDQNFNTNNIVQDFDLTPAEEAVLDNWVDNHF